MKVKLLLLASVAAVLVHGQETPQPRRNTYRSGGGASGAARLVSPEIHGDRKVTFRVRAPKATEVALQLGAVDPKPVPFSKGENGVWSITVGPLEPDIYTYTFLIDGARALDVANPNLKTGAAALDASVLEIPGSGGPRFDEVQNVPHGAIQIRSYFSTPMKKIRGVYIYTPPEYDTNPTRKFPVLYLRHGGGDTESNWSTDGRAGVILDNLLAQGKAKPMLIVMTNGMTDGSWAGGSSAQGMEMLSQELFADVIPLVERNYRVLGNRENRAITGLSMGGGQAFTIGLRRLDAFAWVGEFSSGLVSEVGFDVEKQVPGLLKDPEAVNRKLKLFWLSCGTEDPRFPGQLDLSDLFKKHGIRHEFHSTPGAHEWKVWRHLLAEFLPRLFQS